MKEKSLIKNSIYNVFYKLLNAIFPMISTMYISHILLAKGVGRVASAQNLVQYFVTFATLGIPNYGIREISANRGKKDEIIKIFWELFSINMCSTLLCGLSYLAIINVCSYFKDSRTLFFIVGMSILLNIFNVDWLYQGMEEFEYIAKRSFFVKIISLLLLILYVREKEDYLNYAIISVVAIGGNHIFNIANLFIKYKMRFDIRGIRIKQHLKPIFILFSTSIAIELYTLLDTTMLTLKCQEENVGYYTNSMKIVKIIISIIAGISGILLPRLSYYHKIGKDRECERIINKVLEIMSFLFIPCGISIILAANRLIPVAFGISFSPAIKTLKIAALLVYTLGFSNLFGTQVLLTFGGEKKLLISTIVGALSNIVLNFFLIPSYKENGAVVASVISELLVTFTTYMFSSRYIKFKIDYRVIVISIISCLFMTVGMVIALNRFNSDILALIISAGVGVLLYISVNVALKNPIFNTEIIKM